MSAGKKKCYIFLGSDCFQSHSILIPTSLSLLFLIKNCVSCISRQGRAHRLLLFTHCFLVFSITDPTTPLGIEAPTLYMAPKPPVFISPVVEMTLPVLDWVCRQGLSLVAPWWPAKSSYAEIIHRLAARLWQLYLPAPSSVYPYPEPVQLHAYLLRSRMF